MRSPTSARLRVLATVAAASLMLSALPAVAATPSADLGTRLADDAERLQQWREANTSAPALPAALDQSAFSGDDVVAGKLAITTDTAEDTSWVSGAAVAGGAVTEVASRVQLVTVEAGTEAETAARIAAQPGVRAVEPVGVAQGHAVPNDPDYGLQYAHPQVGAPEAWDITTGGAGTLAVVIDSGVNSGHPDLGGQIVDQLRTIDGAVGPGTEGDNDDFNDGHGTWVSGVLGATGNNGVGIAGVNWDTDIIDINAQIEFDLYTFVDVAASIAYGTEVGADVVNMSLGGPSDACPAFLQAVVDDATAANTVVVASAGNFQEQDPGQTQIPASCNGVLSIGATEEGGGIAPYSNNNDFVDLSAPGSAMYTTNNPNARVPDEEYTVVSGTSFAAPYVSGAVTLLRSLDPAITPAQVEGVLEATAVNPNGEDTFTPDFGWGEIDLAAAVALAETGEYPDPAPNPEFPVGEPPAPSVPRLADPTNFEETNSVDQAVAASQSLFLDDTALWAVVVRGDEYADALTGSALTAGVAPLLFTGSDELPGATAAELTRALPEGSTVYVLGGEQAISAEIAAEIGALGFQVTRLGGATRGETSEAIAAEIQAIGAEFDIPIEGAILAKAFDWPDAVTAGSIGATFLAPVVLTGYGEDQINELHPSAARTIEAIDPEFLITVGGTSAVGTETERDAADIGDVPEDQIVRLGGGSRLETGVAVADFLTFVFAELELEPIAFGANVRRGDGWAHLLSATPFVPLIGAVFVPFEGEDGSRYTDPDTAFVREFVQQTTFNPDLPGIVVGGTDVITEEAAEVFFFEDALQ